MSKRGVFWGLGGLLGVVLATTLCILLVTVMGTGAQNSSQSSVEPQVTNLPTGETSDYEIAESPEVEQRAPSYQTPFQPNDGPSVALGPLPSESPPEASFTASSSTVARGETGTMEVVPQVTLSLNFASITEGEGIILTARLTEPLTATKNLTVELTVEGVTPGANLDDIKSAGSQFEFGDALRDIVIPVGESQAGTTIISQNENLAEFDERFRFKVAQLGYGSDRSAPTKESSVELTIENRDFITATITASDTAEGDTVTVTITLDKALPVVPGGLAADDVKLVVRNKNRRADFGGLDENGTLNLVELFDGGTTAVVPLHLVDDMMFEPVEQGRLTVEGSPRLDPLFIDAIAAQNIYAEVRFQIIDNDAVRLFAQARDDVSGPEITTTTENSVFEVFAELAPGVTAERDVNIRFRYEFDSTDENGNVRTPLSCMEIQGCDMYTPSTLVRGITIKQGETRSTDVFFNDVQINDDDIVEETELFQLVPFETVPPATFDSTPIHITVLDNDTLTYEIKGDATIDENAGSYTVQLRRTGMITADAMVPYTVSGGDSSPASEADFDGSAFPSGSFTFTGYDALSDEVSIMIENDGASEFTETFKISVTGGTSTPKEVAIIDDDPPGMPAPSLPTISLEVPDVVFENLSALHDLTATLSGPVMETVTVRLVVGPDSTALEGSDYTLMESPFVIAAGQVTARFRLYAPTDSSHDGDKHLVLTPIATIGTTEVMGVSRTITIRDIDPPPTLSITTDSFETTEPAITSNFFIGVELDNAFETDLLVSLKVISSSTAEEGEDFRLLDAVTIDAGSTVGDDSPGLQILPDSIYEGEEYIVLELTTNDPNVRTPPRITITIKDDDDPLPTASLDLIAPTIMEDQDREITARLDAVAGVTVTVSLLRGAESSAVEADYELSPLSVPIAPGELTATFQLSAIDDPLYELGETLTLQPITSYGADTSVGVAQTVTILENDMPPTLSLSGPSTVSENDASVSFKATLSGDLLEADLEVELAVVGGDAVSGDYTLSPARATIRGMQREVEFTLRTNNNDMLDGDKTIELELRRVSGPVVTLGVVALTLTIEEDEQPVVVVPEGEVVTATVSFSATSWYEGDDDALVVTIELADGMVAQSDLTIDYELEFPTIDTDGNRRMAADVADFVGATTGTVLIPAGESSAKIEIASNRPVGYRYLGFNDRGGRGPFVNVAFRQAVATLIDTEQIVRDVLQGVISPIYSVVPEGNGFWHNPDLPRFGSGLDGEARINEAVRILAAGGYTWTVAPSWDTINGRVIAGEGFADSAGQEVRTFEILSVEQSFDPFRFEAANLIAGWLNEAGIPAEVTTSSIGTIVSKIQDYDAWILGWDIETYPRYHLVNTFTTGAFYNLGRWFNDEYDALAAQDFPPMSRPTRWNLPVFANLRSRCRRFLPVNCPTWYCSRPRLSPRQVWCWRTIAFPKNPNSWVSV